jgi:hypothetical protein
VRLSLLRFLQRGSALSLCPPLGLVAISGSHHPGLAPPCRSGQVYLAGDGRQLNTVLVVQVDDFFKLARRAKEQLRLPAHDRVDQLGVDVSHQLPPLRPGQARSSRNVIVGIHPGHRPVQPITQRPAIFLLPRYAQAGAYPVLGEPDIDGRPRWARDLTLGFRWFVGGGITHVARG